MATRYVEFTGPVRWAKVFPGQQDMKFKTESKGGSWSVIQTLDDNQVKLYNGLGLKFPAKTEEDILIAGLKAKKNGKPAPDMKVNDVSWKRTERHPKLGNLGSPAVLGCPEGKSIGNDSVCKVVAEVYPYSFEGTPGFAARLVSLEVLNLVEYVKPSVDEDGPPVF